MHLREARHDLRTDAQTAGAPRFQGTRARAAVLGIATLVTCLVLASAASAQEGPNVLNPRGPQGTLIAELWWVLFWLGLAVFVVVMALLFVAIFRRRQTDAAEGRFFTGTGFVALGGAVIPFIVLMVVFGFTLRALLALAEPDEPAPLTIDVVGHQFWWEVRYPEEGVVTANEIHIPTDQPVSINLTGGDVIHSFWVPQLAGKMDLIPGKTSTIWLQADEPGEYRGQCAEFCGIQHAHMAFLVIAQPPGEFAEWLDHQGQPSSEPAPDSLVARGEQIFLGSACVYCHTVRGTNASGELGPDLTHLASRRTLAAGTLENNLGNLSGWIIDPQSIKPGNQMPATNLRSEELQELLAYLMSLD